MILIKTKEYKGITFGGQLTQKCSKTVKNKMVKQNMVIFMGKGWVTLIRKKGDKGVSSGGLFDSKRSKNGEELSKIWSFLR